MKKTLWYSLYAPLALLTIAAAGATVITIPAAFAVSPWFIIGLPVGIVITVSIARLAGWAADAGIGS